MSVPFPEPTTAVAGRSEVYLGYLDYFRDQVTSRLAALSEQELRHSRLPSGWTPIELLAHLRGVEVRWLEWGFEGRDVGDPWAEERDGRWHVAPEETLADLVAALHARAARTREIVAAHDLAEVGAPGARWDGAPPATLDRILMHVVQEYARHAGHLDIVAELAVGTTGE
jgi:uncharacterized damage-inducible protein DinB